MTRPETLEAWLDHARKVRELVKAARSCSRSAELNDTTRAMEVDASAFDDLELALSEFEEAE